VEEDILPLWNLLAAENDLGKFLSHHGRLVDKLRQMSIEDQERLTDGYLLHKYKQMKKKRALKQLARLAERTPAPLHPPPQWNLQQQQR
jgi:hypothetical protein